MAFYSEQELLHLGLAKCGKNVLISKNASLYNPAMISIGSNVRIDDFCVLSAGVGGIEIGDYVHIAVFCSLIGAAKITIANFCNLSSRVSVYSSNDDYSGEHMTNPMVPVQYTGVISEVVNLEKHVIIGSGTVILPGVTLEQGVAVGSLSLINKNCTAFGVYVGIPAVRKTERKCDLISLENELINSIVKR